MGRVHMGVDDITTSAGSTSIAIAGATTVYTHSFKMMAYGEFFSIAYRAVSSASTPDVTIQLEQSWAVPTTEGSSDTSYVIPSGMSDIITNLTTELWNMKTLSPIPMPYGRFKITGNSGNAADTVVNIKIGSQQE